MLYVYAVVDVPAAPLPPCAGHDGAGLLTVAGAGIAAVCSRHAEDLVLEPDEGTLWVHERVLEALLEDRAVLPARFGTTVADEAEVRDILARRRRSLASGLDLVRGRREIGVRILWDPPEPEVGAEGPGTGTAYLLDRVAAMEAARDRAAQLHGVLFEQAVTARHRALVTPRLLLSGAYLVERDAVGAFVQAADALAAAHPEIQVVCTGPWPAHTFALEDGDDV
jgi:hypothetical protein